MRKSARAIKRDYELPGAIAALYGSDLSLAERKISDPLMGTGWENNRVSMLGGGGGARSTRRRTFHGPQRITRNLDESPAKSCDELEGSDATMSMASGIYR